MSLFPNCNLHETIFSGTSPEHAIAIEPTSHFPSIGNRNEPGFSFIETVLDHKINGIVKLQVFVFHHRCHLTRQSATYDGLALTRARDTTQITRISPSTDQRRVTDSPGHFVHQATGWRRRRAPPLPVHHHAANCLRRVHAYRESIHLQWSPHTGSTCTRVRDSVIKLQSLTLSPHTWRRFSSSLVNQIKDPWLSD